MRAIPVIVVGAGGHAKVLIDALQRASIEVIAVTDREVSRHGDTLLGVPIRGDDEWIFRNAPDAVELVNGIGSIRPSARRAEVFRAFAGRGYTFVRVTHPTAIIGADAELGMSTQVMAGAVVQAGCRIGENVIINTGATLDHDCIIGDHVHVSPRATLCGGVVVGAETHIGAGATVIQGIRIGARCLVAAGAVVVTDVAADTTVMGVPARKV